MALELKQAVIHSFTKQAKTSVVSEVVKKEVLLNKDLPAVITLVTGVNSLLGKTGNSVSYGQFGSDMREGPFPSVFDTFSAKDGNNELFLNLSTTAVDELVLQAQAESLSTGGHILVAHYLSDGVGFTLIAMIKQRGGVTLDENYVPIEITEMDLSKIYQAVRINHARYLEVTNLPDPQEEGDEDLDLTYLCFLGQGRNNQASAYFVKALGCTKGIGASRATNNAISAVEKFFGTPELRKYRTRARDSVVAYLQGKLTAGENASLDEICHAACSIVAPEDIGSTEALKEFLNNDSNQVPSQFPVHATTLKKKIRIKADAGNWAIQFEQQILGSTTESVIYYNKDNRTLTISSLTDQLVASIEAEINSRTVN